MINTLQGNASALKVLHDATVWSWTKLYDSLQRTVFIYSNLIRDMYLSFEFFMSHMFILEVHCYRYEGALDPWMSSLWNSLHQYNPKLLPKGPDVTADTTFIDQTNVQVTYHEEVDGLHSEFAAMTGNNLIPCL